MKKIKELFVELREQQIKLFLKGDDIKISSYKDKISPEQILKIKSNKDEIVKYLKSLNENNSVEPIPVIESKSKYPMSNAQQRVWILSQTSEGSTAYNLPTEIELNGKHDRDCLERAILSVIERHEILRTLFNEDENGEPYQIVLDYNEVKFNMEFFDFRGEKDPQAASKTYVLSDSFKPFDLAKGPLLRASLLQVSDDKFIFYYNMHHIISDGWSMEVLIGDVMKYYNAYVSGENPKISPLRIQYKDYSAWQLAQVNDTNNQKHKEYWTSLLDGTIPVLDLPSKKRRPIDKTFSGKSLGMHISSEIIENLQHFVKGNGGSLFMGLLTVSKILLYKYTGETDIVIGNPIAGRDHSDLENQIGVYINTLALRSDIDPNNSFIELFEKIKETTLKSLEHQMYPFDRLLEDLNIRRAVNRSPLFDILINYLGVAESSMYELSNHKVCDLGEKMILFDIEIDFTEVASGIDFIVRYNDDVYENETIQNFILHYKILLNELLKYSDKSIGKAKYLLEEEREVLLNEFNDTKVLYPKDKTVVDLFTEQVNITPDAVSVLFKDQTITYKELDKKSNYLAHHLIKKGVSKEDFVPICMDKSIEMVIGILAVLKSGGAYVPIDPNYPKERIDYILEDTKSNVILSALEFENVLEGYISKEIIYLDQEYDIGQEDNLCTPNNQLSPDNLAYLIYTSGSTGKPKGVKIEHKALVNFLLSMCDHLTFDQNIKFLSLTTFTFDISILEILSPLLLGGQLILVKDEEAKDPEYITSVIHKTKPNCIQGTPSRWKMLLSNEGEVLENLTLLSGGESIDYELKEKLTKLSNNVWNLYGPTETTIWSCASRLLKERKITIGKPIANTQIYILGEHLSLIPQGMVGQLCIGGTGLARGYLNHSELTNEKFVNNPFEDGERLYLTGDLARWLPDGTIEFLGRNDHQIKINGYRIEVGEIEHALAQIEDIEQSVVTAIKDDNGIVQLVGYIISTKEINQKKIQDDLLNKLPEYMVPRIYVQLEEIPLTHNGKINRKVLPLPVIKEEYVEPYNEVQRKLTKIWEDILQIEKVGIRDDFFQVGGNSLRGIRMLNAINKEFGLKYDLRGIYAENTIELIGERIEVDLTFKEDKVLDENEFSEIKI
ncbi:non-ribosomal peptide synthetase [Aquimarina rhabdastrellae]